MTGRTLDVRVTHCGGAALPPGVEGAQRTPVPATRVLVRPGNSNSTAPVAAWVLSDAHGTFTLDLPAGSWCLLTEAQAANPPPANLALTADRHASCMMGERSRCSEVVRVGPGEQP